MSYFCYYYSYLLVNPFYLVCNPNPCKNGGTCTEGAKEHLCKNMRKTDCTQMHTAICTCAEGFSGDTCEIPAGNP